MLTYPNLTVNGAKGVLAGKLNKKQNNTTQNKTSQQPQPCKV